MQTPPKLAVIDISSETAVLKDRGDTRALKELLRALVACLHPCGTIAFGLPRPWFMLGAHVAGTQQALSILQATRLISSFCFPAVSLRNDFEQFQLSDMFGQCPPLFNIVQHTRFVPEQEGFVRGVIKSRFGLHAMRWYSDNC